MTKANSNLHRAVALLAALCLLASMALPVYAAETEPEFSVSNSETIPTITAANTASEGAEPAQKPIVSGLEMVPGEEGTPPTANVWGTEPGNTVNNTEAVPNNDGKTQEAAENPTPAADKDTAPAETSSAPADLTLTNKAPDGQVTTVPDTAVTPDNTTDAKKNAAAKTNTEQDNLFDAGDDPDEEDTMLAGDLPDSDDANAPDTIANTSESMGFIPSTATIYFEDDGRYDSTYNGNCTIHFYAQKVASTDGSVADLNKDMVDTGKTTNSNGEMHRIFSVTLNSADYPDGGFYRVIFQYQVNGTWQEEIFAFGNGNHETGATTHWTAIDQLAGKKFVRTDKNTTDKNYNRGSPYNDTQWKRVEYYYKGMPLYFKNASDTALEGVTAVFYKKGTDGTVEETAHQEIGTVGANQFYAQKILIPDNQSQFVQFTWGDNGKSSVLYNFSTEDYTSTEKFNLTTANCFVYNDTTPSWQSAGSDLLTGGKTIYFDATLSSYSYAGEYLPQSAMGDGDTMYCFLTDSTGNVTSQKMTPVAQGNDSATPDRQLWYYTIPEGCSYTAVQFSATNNKATPAQDNKTKPYSTADLPPTLTNPCFFADDGDPSAYASSGNAVFRDGYWGEKDSRRDAESGKNTTVVDIASGEFTQESGTKYITSTLYDYYTDYELNGLNRDTYPDSNTNSQRGYVTFEQFDRALSSAYKNNANVKYPLYTGHFQPSIDGWGNPFATVAAGMGLYGWDGDTNSEAYKTFMAVNNSALDDKGGTQANVFDRTFQGLVESKTFDGTANGLPLLRTKDSTDTTKTALVDPHFDEDFLQGKNSFNTVLGKVYKDVSFPFTKDAVFEDSTKSNDPEQYAQYWYYDSSKASLYLKQDQTDGKYYLESPKDGCDNPTMNDQSKNMDPGSGSKSTHGFFPFNETVPGNANAAQYNYGFGAKLQFDFTLTDDGQVVAGNDSNTKVPIKFFFSGDDDVWVYIDGELVLDVGGAHGAASGLLEFGTDSTVTPYVSSNKNTDTSDTMVYQTYDNPSKTVYFNKNPITFKNKGAPIQLDANRTTHTLTMYYMERGMWESNMAVAFNFPDHNELQVEKQVDLRNVNDDFKPLFQDQNLFTFALQNLATHYGTKTIDDKTPKPVKVGSDFSASSATEHTIMKKGEAPPDTGSQAYKGQTVIWHAQGYDKNSEYRSLRYGTMTLDSPLNIEKNRDYLSFDVYAVGGDGDGVLSTNYLYLTLVDSSEKQMGCDANGEKSYLNTMLSGSVVMKNNQWVTVKLQLNKMHADSGFDLKNIKEILIGDDYERTVYFRNFVFTAKPVANTTVGFSVEQKDIPDYGSAESGSLMPAGGAIFTSSVASNGTQAVDTDGTFDLQGGETVTFTDQFRRGSYISLQEVENTALYDTRWEVYENGTLVSTAGTSSSVSGATPTPLKGNGTKPEDNRTETKDTPLTGSGYTGSKPDANTLVFRSYATPEEEFPKLKVKFVNTVKVGTLVIKKDQPSGETPLTGNYHFTVTFSNVGGIGLGGADGKKMTKDLAVGESWIIAGIPVGTRFRVVEETPTNSSLQSVTCSATDAKYDVDNGVRGTVASESQQVTATFTNTAHQLMDIEVEKKWLDTEGYRLTDNQSDTVWVKLQRRHTGTSEVWQDVPSMDAVELKYDYMSKTWTHKFERLDKTDVKKVSNPYYEYRVLESATGNDDWHGGTDGDVIEISGKKYKVLNTTRVTGDSDDKTLTLTNRLQDVKYKLVITKQDAQDATKKLGGVEFKLEKLNDAGTAETTYNGTTGSDGTNQGKCSFTPLTPGSYRLTETKTAEGYTLLAEPIEFTLTADGQCKRGDETFGTKTTDADGVCNIALTIYNRKGFALPHTGADAPSLWLLIGLPALVAVLLVLVFRYNKKGGRRQ